MGVTARWDGYVAGCLPACLPAIWVLALLNNEKRDTWVLRFWISTEWPLSSQVFALLLWLGAGLLHVPWFSHLDGELFLSDLLTRSVFLQAGTEPLLVHLLYLALWGTCNNTWNHNTSEADNCCTACDVIFTLLSTFPLPQNTQAPSSLHKARWSQKDFEVSEQQDGCSWWCWNKESAQQVAEKGDLQYRVKAVARGPAMGSAIPAEVRGGNELFRGSMWRAEEQGK